MNEYIKRKLSGPDLENELVELISKYNRLRKTYLFIYATAFGKSIPAASIEQDDFYIIRDLLATKRDINNIDMYLETPGGSGETAEEIVRYLHEKFEKVSFVVSGEAKSAGTIIVMSGDEILMTETGSLGPIDAQMRIGRSVVAAHDYMEWVNEKRDEAELKRRLNPFDATMVAQITPGELVGVNHALKFAEDLVVDWLVKYKFKNWICTETNKTPVTDELKTRRAQEIAHELTNHSKWRLHGRSLKIGNLEEIGLKINRVDGDLVLADIVYRIHTVCRMLFDNTTAFKIFATEENKIFRHAVPVNNSIKIPKIKGNPEVLKIEQKCPKCGLFFRIYGKFISNPQIDRDFKKLGFKPFPKDAKLKCRCGYEIDLSGLKNEMEIKTGKKIIM